MEKQNIPSLPVLAVPEQPTNVSLSKPTGTLCESSLSIKAQLNEIRKKQLVPESELPRNQFNSDLLLAATRRYAHVLKNLGKETFYHALIKRDPQLNDETITITVDNEVQIAYITPILSEFVDYLKEDLKNGFIQVHLRITDQVEENLKPVSGKDKYQALARKNPNIHTLKNRFNLDIEF